MYNHSYKPNATFKIKNTQEVVDFIAAKNIKSHDEITINYNQENPNKDPMWFENN
ncbi:SET domain-containing protein-lysine N-methyltransferase [Patescibacteria group bacterium]